MMRPDPGYGNGSISTAYTTLNTALVAPMPSANDKMAVSANPGRFHSSRHAYRKSDISDSIGPPRRNWPSPYSFAPRIYPV